MIRYNKLVFNKEDIKKLYLDNDWYAYTNEIEKLYKGIQNSTDVLGAYKNELLVGLIRTVSDQQTICYIQDILVLKSYQGKGIGKVLMKMIFDKYKHIRQIVLMTDNTPSSIGFYKSLDMVAYEEVKGIGFILKKN